jgi:periplasmic protein TonB
MLAPVIFKDLPATFPEKDKYKKSSIISSLVFHGLLIFVVIIVPLLIPQTIPERELLITLVSPIGPPPPPPPPPVEVPVVAAPKAVQQQVRPVTPDTLVTPIVIPREVVKIIDEPIVPTVGVVGGVPGGIPGGLAGGVLGGILAANAPPPPAIAPPPPPPPPPAPPSKLTPVEPVRVGGMVKEPKVLKMVPPVYPPLASRARVSGTVILEATLTAQGSVEEIKVVSGHPLLIEAAINCVKQWQYEPTYLNGVPVPIILTAKVHFLKAVPST